ncbi:branched-chain amino acid ABC transporter permease [Ramlibacter sp.]|uniref:branched-chain amino acid ABC transporter permease n=1 Tax=Ramlibacter sp. TaxID=1917967 RepID=UPI003D0F5D4E
MDLLQVAISGVALGCVYGLVALGFVLIYKATEVVNFAQGDFMMLGAFVAYTFGTIWKFPFWLMVPCAFVTLAVFGAVYQMVVLKRVVGQPTFAAVMVTIGTGYALRGLVTMVPGWGTETRPLKTPLSESFLRLGGVTIAMDHIVIIVSTAALCVALYLLFKKTTVGIAMNATSQNQLAAYYVGIPVHRMNTLIWSIAAGIAAFAAMLLAPITFVHNNMGSIAINAFPAAVVGGFGSIPGALVGGVIIGLAESLAGYLLPEGFKAVAPHLVVLTVLIVRPSGIFSALRKKKV